MEKEKRALSWREFVESGFDGREYQFPDFEGTFAATIACKRWDRNKNLLAYLDFDDGRKIMTSAWSEKNYLGLADIPLNTRVIRSNMRICLQNALHGWSRDKSGFKNPPTYFWVIWSVMMSTLKSLLMI